MTDPAFDLAQLDSRPNWYDHLSQVEAAMADQYRTEELRRRAGWYADEGGWYSPDGVHEAEWEAEARPLPEDEGYTDFWSAYIHYEALDSAPTV